MRPFELFLDWQERVKGVRYFRNTQTGHIFELAPFGISWDAFGECGLIRGELFMDDHVGRKKGTTIGSNYLDVEPLTDVEVMAWAAR